MVAIDNEAKRVEALKAGAGITPTVAAAPPPAAGKSPAGATASTATKGKISASDKRRIESWLVGKTWEVANHDEFLFFDKDGKGNRKLRGTVGPFAWRMGDDGTVFVDAGYPKSITFTGPTEATIVIRVRGTEDTEYKLRISNEVIDVAASPPAASKPPADATASPSGKGRVTAGDKRRIESWIVGKTWAAVTEEDQLLYFAKDGKGARRLRGEVTTVLEWRMQEDGTVTVARAGWGKRITFVNATEAVVVYTDGNPGEGFKMRLSTEVIEGTK
jgi:hypothetical protein